MVQFLLILELYDAGNETVLWLPTENIRSVNPGLSAQRDHKTGSLEIGNCNVHTRFKKLSGPFSRNLSYDRSTSAIGAATPLIGAFKSPALFPDSG